MSPPYLHCVSTVSPPWGNRHVASGPSFVLLALAAEVRDSRVRAVLALIERRPAYSVRELANEVHLSPGQLQRLFKQETGAHISDLLVQQRLQKAAHLLSASDLSIKEIAYAAGYEHHSSFTRAFEHRFAQSPKHYRQQSDSAKC